MRSLRSYIAEDFDEVPDYDEISATIPGGVDIALVGELRLLTQASEIFSDRKEKIAKYYMNEIPVDMVWTADFIANTPIFKYYLRDVIDEYKKSVDDNLRLNISTHDELARQLANDIIILSKKLKLN